MNSTVAPSDRSRFATAIDGVMWPAVPPPAITTLTVGSVHPRSETERVLLSVDRTPSSATLATTPTPASVTTNAVPPNERNGSGTPVIGSNPVTAPRFTRVCNPIQPVIPATSKRPKGSRACIAMRMPANSRTPKSDSTAIAPTRPSSSPRTPNTKSLCAFGR